MIEPEARWIIVDGIACSFFRCEASYDSATVNWLWIRLHYRSVFMRESEANEAAKVAD
jgi:hypothetical protein